MKKTLYTQDQSVCDHIHPTGSGSCWDEMLYFLVLCVILAFFDLVGRLSRVEAGLFLEVVGENLVVSIVYCVVTSPCFRFFFWVCCHCLQPSSSYLYWFWVSFQPIRTLDRLYCAPRKVGIQFLGQKLVA